MLNKGIIRPSTSPWSSPVVIVNKKSPDGTPKYRFCVDYRALNAITHGDAYPLPNIVETLDCLNNSIYFTTLDLYSGFHQVKMVEEDIEKTAFSLPGCHYEFKNMPFGLCNAPATFQRLMDSILFGIKGEEALVYLDDIIVFSNSMEQHAERLGKVLNKLENSNLYAQLSKCVFAVNEVEYLGHIVSDKGIQPDPKKIVAIKNYSKPRTVKEIIAFIGLVGYFFFQI
uniref:Reverse transcriptase domain-containing protein n=1 Tax=Clastoptera arizonana TaxID=38151 RepID=A0A1B6DY26_9HEMI